MSVETATVSATELDRWLVTGGWPTCEMQILQGVTFSFAVGDRKWHWRFPWRSRSCGKSAAALLTVTCPEHGTRAKAVCRLDLVDLRGGMPVECATCHRLARWIDTGA